MNRHKAAPLVVLLAVAIGLGWWWYTQRQEAAQADAALTASGTVDADQVQVTSLTSGRVVDASLAEGDVVKKGDVLYRLDDETLRLQVEQAKSAVTAAKAALDQAIDDDESDADIAAARAAWEQARAAERIARVQLGYATVTAPSAGTVTSIAVREGELAAAGRTLATITRTDALFVRAFVPEPSIGRIAVGGAATVETDAGKTTDATVTFIASEAQFTPSSVETADQRAELVYEVRLKPADVAGLNPGMPVTITFAEK